MSKGKWIKNRNKDEIKSTAVPTTAPPNPPELKKDPIDTPLPPFSSSPLPSLADIKAPLMDESKLKAGLAKTFCSTTQGLARSLNFIIEKSGYVIEFSVPSAEEGELWAEFALPVLKQWFPKLETQPGVTLCVVSGLILSGKIHLKKKGIKMEVFNNDHGDQAGKSGDNHSSDVS